MMRLARNADGTATHRLLLQRRTVLYVSTSLGGLGAKQAYLSVQALEQVLGQRGEVAEALQGGVEEAGVAQVAEPRAHPVHPLPL